MARNNNFDYYHSESLNLDYAIRKDDQSKITFSDGVVYTEEEARLIKEASPMVHKIKKVFSGQIVDNKARKGL